MRRRNVFGAKAEQRSQFVLDGAVRRWAREIASDLSQDDASFPLSKEAVKKLVKHYFDSMSNVFYGGVYGWDDCAAILADLARMDDGVDFTWPAQRGSAGELFMVAAHNAVAAYIISIADQFSDIVENIYNDLYSEHFPDADDDSELWLRSSY
jgi:hypothetical protein